MVHLNHEGMIFPLPDYNYSISENYIIYGTGEVASSFYEQLSEIVPEEKILYFVDSSNQKESFKNKKVLPPERIPDGDKAVCRFILASFTSTIGMQSVLMKYGVPPQHIIRNRKYTFANIEQYLNSVERISLYPEASENRYMELLDKLNYYIPILKDTPVAIENGLKRDSGSTLVLVWKKECLIDEVLRDIRDVYCIDPEFFQYLDIKILIYINYILASAKRKEHRSRSKRNFAALKEQYGSSAVIFGTGPSLSEGIIRMEELKLKKPLLVGCNGGIFSKLITEKVKPNLYVISDVGLLTEELSEMRTRIVDYVAGHSCYLILCDWWIPYMERKYPEMEEKLIGISDTAAELQFPDEDHLSVLNKAHNVITRFAVPVASAVCGTVYLTGCDGVDLSQNQDTRFVHEQGIKDAPGRGPRRYDYFVQHYSYFEELLAYGEGRNKVYYSLTDSFIPALQQRKLKSDKQGVKE